MNLLLLNIFIFILLIDIKFTKGKLFLKYIIFIKYIMYYHSNHYGQKLRDVNASKIFYSN